MVASATFPFAFGLSQSSGNLAQTSTWFWACDDMSKYFINVRKD